MGQPLSQRFPRTSAFLSKTNTKISNFSDWFMPPPYDRLAYGFAGIRDAPIKNSDSMRLPQLERKLSKDEQTRKELQGPMLNGGTGMPRGGTTAVLGTHAANADWRAEQLRIDANKKIYDSNLNPKLTSEVASKLRGMEDEARKNRYEVECKERGEKFKRAMGEYNSSKANEEDFDRKIYAIRYASSENEQKELIFSIYSNVDRDPYLYSWHRKELNSWFSDEQKRNIRDSILYDSEMSFSEKKRCLPKIGVDVFRLRYARLFIHHMISRNVHIVASLIIGTAALIIGAVYGVQGIRHLQKQNAIKSIKPYTEMVDKYPSYSSVYFNRAYMYHEIGEYEKAIIDYTKAIELEPIPETYYNRGISYAALGKDTRAIGDYSSAISLRSDFVSAYENRAKAYERLGMDNAAEADRNAIEMFKIRDNYNNESWIDRELRYFMQNIRKKLSK